MSDIEDPQPSGDRPLLSVREGLEAYREQMQPKSDYLRDIYADTIISNYQILIWYRRERTFLLIFRVLFAFIFYSVPYTITSILLWANVVDKSTSSVLELLLVSWYQAPIIFRAFNEFSFFVGLIPMQTLVMIQMDILVVVALYLTSASTNGAKEHVASFATGAAVAVPSALVFSWAVYRRYTIYAFGLSSKYNYIPQPLKLDYDEHQTGLKRHFGTFTRDVVGLPIAGRNK